MFPSPKLLPFTIIRNARVPSKLPTFPSETSAKSFKSPPNSLTLSSYNRKDKSLEELSRKFLQMFLSSQESCISLDRITEALGVERRRIYDIINILESLNLVSRKGKNNYRWNGFHKVYETLKAFENGSFSRFFAQIQEEFSLQAKTLEISKTFAEDCQENPQKSLGFSEVAESFLEKTPNAAENAQKTRESAPIKREKSLKLLSIGFLELFLRWKSTMSLEEAAKRLNERLNVEENKIKTKIRRLYDIANVFKSLGLIKKTLTDHKKPAFTWLGTPGLDEFVESNRVSQEKLGESQRNNTEFLVKCLMNLIENNAKSPNKLSFVTPVVKKTLTIIYPRTDDTQTPASNEKSEAFTREVENFLIPQPIFKEKDVNSLKECTNTMKNYKRSALAPISQALGVSRASSFKKIKRNCDSVENKENFNPF